MEHFSCILDCDYSHKQDHEHEQESSIFGFGVFI